jgi:adenosine deaminase
MNKFRYYFILLITTLSLFSCSKDEVLLCSLRDYKAIYFDLVIEEYLNSYYLTVTIIRETDDQDVVFTKYQLEERNHRLCLI